MLLESFQMFLIFLSNKKCRLEHVVNKLMSCLITEFLWIFSYKLHGILSNSMDTLWHSMELHRYFREPHGIPWNSMDLQGNSMEFHGIPWNYINTSWNSVAAFHGTPWILHGTPWHSMELHGCFMEVPWNSMDFHGFPWNSMDFHRFPWNSMEVFHTGRTTTRIACLISRFIDKWTYDDDSLLLFLNLDIFFRIQLQESSPT